MKAFKYVSGEEVRAEDLISYHGEDGKVEFVVVAKTGDPALDWYLDEFPRGGFMITAKGFGSIFIAGDDIDEDLEFVARSGPRR